MNRKDSLRQLNGHTVDVLDLINLAYEPGVSLHTGQSAEDVTLLRFFNKKSGGFYVDIGAYDPVKYSNTYLLHRLYRWRGINIDPSATTIEKFNKIRPNDINLNYAIDTRKGNRKYFRFSSQARNTLSADYAGKQRKKNDVVALGEDIVRTAPLKGILKEHLPEDTTIDVMNIDVEGLEMNVLESNDWEMFRPTVIVIEDHSIQKSGVYDSKLHSYLNKKNYRLFSHHFDTSFYVDTLQNEDTHLVRQASKELHDNLRSTDNLQGIIAAIRIKVPSVLPPNEVRLLQKELDKATSSLNTILSSASWRMTAPLRHASKLIKRK